MRILVNGIQHEVEAAKDTPLLWVLRDHLALTGTKFGCGVGICGACRVLIDGVSTPSCIARLGAVEGRAITTIEGISADNGHPVQQAWEELQVPQCGYCQSGQIISAVALLSTTRDPDDAAINGAMSAVLCRCGTYPRVRDAVKLAARKVAADRGNE